MINYEMNNRSIITQFIIVSSNIALIGKYHSNLTTKYHLLY